MSAIRMMRQCVMLSSADSTTGPAPLASGTRSILPPCRVCGGKASGLHYCVNTCQSCRMFFRRMLKRTEIAECLKAGSCRMDASSVRNACPSCRYKKCVAVGMKVNDKHVGRYSHAMRTTYTEEVQALELHVQVSPESQSLLSTNERDTQLNHMINELTSRYLQLGYNQMDVISRLPHIEEQIVKEKKIKTELFGPLKLLPHEEYEQIYQSTGLDVDGRRELCEQLFPTIEQRSHDYIAFAKAIPGFQKLSMKEKVSVFRECVLKAKMMNAYYLYNEDLQTWTIPHQSMCSIDHMEHLHDHHGVYLLKRAMVAMQRLDLTPQEAAVLLAYLITNVNADCSPDCRRVLSHMCDTTSELLWRVITQHHDHPRAFFTKVINVLLLIEEVSSIFTRELMDKYRQHSDMNWPFFSRVCFDTKNMEALYDLWNDVLNLE